MGGGLHDTPVGVQRGNVPSNFNVLLSQRNGMQVHRGGRQWNDAERNDVRESSLLFLVVDDFQSVVEGMLVNVVSGKLFEGVLER